MIKRHFTEALLEDLIEDEQSVQQSSSRKLSKEAEEFLAEEGNEQYRAQLELFEGNYNYPAELINSKELQEDILDDVDIYCPETEIEDDDYSGMTDSDTFSGYHAERKVKKYYYATVTPEDGLKSEWGFEDTPYVKLCVELDLYDTIELEGEVIPGSYYDGSRFRLPDEYKTRDVDISAYVTVSGFVDCYGQIATAFEGEIDVNDIY